MKVKIFGRKECPACKSMLEKFKIFLSRWGIKDKVEILYYNVDEVDGLCEASMSDVHDYPTVIIENEFKEVFRKYGSVKSEEFKKCFEKLINQK